jgi:hypothetical protein
LAISLRSPVDVLLGVRDRVRGRRLAMNLSQEGLAKRSAKLIADRIAPTVAKIAGPKSKVSSTVKKVPAGRSRKAPLPRK